MWVVFSFLACVCVAGEDVGNPVRDQLVRFKEKTQGPIGILTTRAGAPVNSIDAKFSLNRRLLFNEYFLEPMTSLVRERIPERMNHAKGAGAFGYFQVTHDITNICKAKMFNKIGKKTPIAVRFSPTAPERGSAETTRDNRGFAVKFYTDDGNFDLVALAFPMFAVKDPSLFPSFTRVQKRNPATNIRDPNMLWDFITLNPESMFLFMMAFSDIGIPDGYRYMPGFGVHTFQVVNEHGETFFVRFHILPDGGIRTLSSENAQRIAGKDPDYATRDLYNAIGNGNYPTWTLSVQVLTVDDVKKAEYDVFDVTRILPEDKYPLSPIGRIVLNKNPKNFHADIEQLAYNPANLVPGILGAPDKLFEARRLAYRDAELYRLGVNFNKIAVNCPIKTSVYTYNKDGVPPVKDNGGEAPNYYPNSFNGPVEYIEKYRDELVEIIQDPAVNNFGQMTDLYTGFSKEERNRFIENILFSIRPAAKFLQNRALNLFTHIHPDFGYRVEQGLTSNMTDYYHY